MGNQRLCRVIAASALLVLGCDGSGAGGQRPGAGGASGSGGAAGGFKASGGAGGSAGGPGATGSGGAAGQGGAAGAGALAGGGAAGGGAPGGGGAAGGGGVAGAGGAAGGGGAVAGGGAAGGATVSAGGAPGFDCYTAGQCALGQACVDCTVTGVSTTFLCTPDPDVDSSGFAAATAGCTTATPHGICDGPEDCAPGQHCVFTSAFPRKFRCSADPAPEPIDCGIYEFPQAPSCTLCRTDADCPADQYCGSATLLDGGAAGCLLRSSP